LQGTIGGWSRGTFEAGAGRIGCSSQLQSFVDLQWTGSTISGVHVPLSQAQNAPCDFMGLDAPFSHDPVAGSKAHSSLLLHPVFAAPPAFRKSVHRFSMHVQLPGRGPLSSQLAEVSLLPTHALGKQASSQPHSASVSHQAVGAFGGSTTGAGMDEPSGTGSAAIARGSGREQATTQSAPVSIARRMAKNVARHTAAPGI
jgi:hypothetical protein